MFKQKKITFILLPAVVIIWGVIAYRIIASVSQGSEGFYREKAIDIVIRPDSIHTSDTLMLNYRDPFGKACYASIQDSKLQETNILNFKPTNSSMVSKIKVETVMVNEVQKSFSSIKISYRGTITNKKDKRSIAILSVNGSRCLLSKGEQYQDLLITDICKDSVLIKYGKQDFWIKK